MNNENERVMKITLFLLTFLENFNTMNIGKYI
uniref:Uncharacterized protein n=1 Tax=Siphoviridae sp. ctHip2 TaxID=2827830 RepID=A0A8S5RWL1_9CAUD|nr:MAG TPA: hypothetical protein [Siphoviridae sp. ctHip2]